MDKIYKFAKGDELTSILYWLSTIQKGADSPDKRFTHLYFDGDRFLSFGHGRMYFANVTEFEAVLEGFDIGFYKVESAKKNQVLMVYYADDQLVDITNDYILPLINKCSAYKNHIGCILNSLSRFDIIAKLLREIPPKYSINLDFINDILVTDEFFEVWLGDIIDNDSVVYFKSKYQCAILWLRICETE